MQGRGRRITPAVVAILVHAAILAGLLSLRPKPQAAPDENILPVVWLEREQAPLPPLAAPGIGLTLPAAPLAITPPNIPLAGAPTDAGPLPLGEYIVCGVGQALTEEERARCDNLRLELFARKDVPPSIAYDLALEQRFSRDKAIQDHPLLRVCYRRMGPDPLCFIPGFEVLYGSVAARDSIPLPLGGPFRAR